MAEPVAPPPAASVPTPDRVAQLQAHRFVEELHAQTPRTFVTYGMMIANTAVFALMVARGVDWLQPGGNQLIPWGANYAPLTTNGEWWRLFTAMFLHGGIIHLAANMWALHNVGRFYERLVGPLGMVVIYFATGLLSSVASAGWNPVVPSVGASGAVFGVFGALLGYLVRQRATIPRLVLRPMMRSVALVVGLNVVIAFAIPFIDHAAHFGGLLSGVLLGLAIARPVSAAGAHVRRRAATSTGLLGFALVLGTTALLPRTANFDAVLAVIADADQSAQSRYAAATNQRTQGILNDADYVRIIETEILPAWRAAHDALNEAGKVPSALAPKVDLLRAYLEARWDFYELRAQGIRTNDATVLRRANARALEANVLAQKLKAAN